MLWSTPFGLNALQVPPVPGGYRQDPYFVFRNARVADVFPGVPGDELLVIHLDWRADAAAVRVYDLAGKVLFEAWHFGHLSDAYWLGADSLLVLSGVNSEANWRLRGHPAAPYVWPMVVLGIRPTLGEKRGWITTSSFAGDLQPAWYRCLTPPEDIPNDARLIPELDRPQPSYADPVKTVNVVIPNAVWMFIDGKGKLAQTPVIMATMHQHEDNPAIANIGLGDLPPIQSQTTPAATPAKK
jgi:hypothetical protein